MNRSSLAGRRAGLAGAAAVVLALAGCGTMSPSVVTQPYDSADGVSAKLTEQVHLHNVLVVGSEQGKSGVVVGAVANDTAEPVTVSITAQLAEGAQPFEISVPVPAQSGVLLGSQRTSPGRVRAIIPQLPVPPGAVVRMSAATQGGGTVELDAPVLLPVNEYASVTPPAQPASPSATPSESPTTAPSGGTGSGESGETGDELGNTEEPTITVSPTE